MKGQRSTSGSSPANGDAAAAAAPGGSAGQAGPEQARPVPLVELLEQSRTFQSPDCTEAMAQALGVGDLYTGLRWAG